VTPALALRLAVVFGTLSVLGFGGGKGIFPQMRLDVVDQTHWLTASQFAQFYTIGKLVPGPATIMVALIGFGVAGVPGAAIAAAAMFVPSSIMMYYVGRTWDRWEGTPIRTIVATGLAPAIIGLVWASVFVIGRGAIAKPAGYAIAGCVALLSLRTSLPTPLLILGAGFAGALTANL
jgi:chromate transporter